MEQLAESRSGEWGRCSIRYQAKFASGSLRRGENGPSPSPAMKSGAGPAARIPCEAATFGEAFAPKCSPEITEIWLPSPISQDGGPEAQSLGKVSLYY